MDHRFLAGWLALCPCARSQSIELVSIAEDGAAANAECEGASISHDATRVLFVTYARNLVPGDKSYSDVFIRDRAAGTTRRVSIASDGTPADGDSYAGVLCGTGEVAFFSSMAKNLGPSRTRATQNVFTHDLRTGTTLCASLDPSGGAAEGFSWLGGISTDGAQVCFYSEASNLIAGDGNNNYDVFHRDLATGVTRRVSVTSAGMETSGASRDAAISGDGNQVAFASDSVGLDPADTDSITDIFVHDIALGTTRLISTAADGTKGDSHSRPLAWSDDGRFLLFSSEASNLVAADTIGSTDHFVKDLATGMVHCISTAPDGSPGASTNQLFARSGALSADGRFALFVSDDDRLVEGDWNRVADVFSREVASGITVRSSISDDYGPLSKRSTHASCSRDGSSVAFATEATDVLSNRHVLWGQVYVLDRRVDAAKANAYGCGTAGRLGTPRLSADLPPRVGSDIVLRSDNSAGIWTVGMLLLGTTEASLSTGFGVELLLEPMAAILIALPPGGGTWSDRVAAAEPVIGTRWLAQVLEVDLWAIEGVSATNGLELVLGY